MILSARFVKRPQGDNLFLCDNCCWPLSGPHIRLYGMGEPGEKPQTLRLHTDCLIETVDTSQEPKIKAALKRAGG